jgi:hypothetical protein
LQCFATPVSAGSMVLLSNIITPFAVVEILILVVSSECP